MISHPEGGHYVEVFKNEEVSFYLKNKKIVSLKLEDKFYRESRITIQNQEFVSPPVSLQERIRKEYHQGQEAIKTYSIEKLKSMQESFQQHQSTSNHVI